MSENSIKKLAERAYEAAQDGWKSYCSSHTDALGSESLKHHKRVFVQAIALEIIKELESLLKD